MMKANGICMWKERWKREKKNHNKRKTNVNVCGSGTTEVCSYFPSPNEELFILLIRSLYYLLSLFIQLFLKSFLHITSNSLLVGAGKVDLSWYRWYIYPTIPVYSYIYLLQPCKRNSKRNKRELKTVSTKTCQRKPGVSPLRNIYPIFMLFLIFI